MIEGVSTEVYDELTKRGFTDDQIRQAVMLKQRQSQPTTTQGVEMNQQDTSSQQLEVDKILQDRGYTPEQIQQARSLQNKPTQQSNISQDYAAKLKAQQNRLKVLDDQDFEWVANNLANNPNLKQDDIFLALANGNKADADTLKMNFLFTRRLKDKDIISPFTSSDAVKMGMNTKEYILAKDIYDKQESKSFTQSASESWDEFVTGSKQFWMGAKQTWNELVGEGADPELQKQIDREAFNERVRKARSGHSFDFSDINPADIASIGTTALATTPQGFAAKAVMTGASAGINYLTSRATARGKGADARTANVAGLIGGAIPVAADFIRAVGRAGNMLLDNLVVSDRQILNDIKSKFNGNLKDFVEQVDLLDKYGVKQDITLYTDKKSASWYAVRLAAASSLLRTEGFQKLPLQAQREFIKIVNDKLSKLSPKQVTELTETNGLKLGRDLQEELVKISKKYNTDLNVKYNTMYEYAREIPVDGFLRKKSKGDNKFFDVISELRLNPDTAGKAADDLLKKEDSVILRAREIISNQLRITNGKPSLETLKRIVDDIEDIGTSSSSQKQLKNAMVNRFKEITKEYIDKAKKNPQYADSVAKFEEAETLANKAGFEYKEKFTTTGLEGKTDIKDSPKNVAKLIKEGDSFAVVEKLYKNPEALEEVAQLLGKESSKVTREDLAKYYIENKLAKARTIESGDLNVVNYSGFVKEVEDLLSQTSENKALQQALGGNDTLYKVTLNELRQLKNLASQLKKRDEAINELASNNELSTLMFRSVDMIRKWLNQIKTSSPNKILDLAKQIKKDGYTIRKNWRDYFDMLLSGTVRAGKYGGNVVLREKNTPAEEN